MNESSNEPTRRGFLDWIIGLFSTVAAGAMGYLLKDTLPDDLIRVIREVHSGRRAIPPARSTAQILFA